MKAVVLDPLPQWLEDRRQRGVDRWDEVWNGVLHMPPAPNREHQDFELRSGYGCTNTGLWNRRRVHSQVNLASHGGWPDRDFRIPDLVLILPDRFNIDRNEYFEGAPNVVVEIRSPHDESYDKLPFYAQLGVPEVWIIDRDNRSPEIYILSGNQYMAAAPSDEGWISSPGVGVELRPGRRQALGIRLAGQPETERNLPAVM